MMPGDVLVAISNSGETAELRQAIDAVRARGAHLADLMRREGLKARHVSGGLREVRRLAEAGTS